MIQIDHGIPIPPRPPQGRPRGASGRRLYPWGTMGVGDSFVFSGTLMAAWQRVHGRKVYDPKRFEARAVTENGKGIVRIWRTA